MREPFRQALFSSPCVASVSQPPVLRFQCRRFRFRMACMPSPPLVLTLKLDDASFRLLDDLRRAHFPPQRNFLSAHVTLFHALPGEHLESVRQTLRETCAAQAKLALDFPRPRSLGRGVAIDVESAKLGELRGRLAARWRPWLSAQDQQRHRAHVTVQNKVTPEEARQLFEELEREWKPLRGRGEGLLLWEYLGGPWTLTGEFDFGREPTPAT